jgi:hypothetical protein
MVLVDTFVSVGAGHGFADTLVQWTRRELQARLWLPDPYAGPRRAVNTASAVRGRNERQLLKRHGA